MKTYILFFLLFACFSFCYSQAEYSHLDRFEKTIQQFEAKDRNNFPPLGEIVFLGSSSIVFWHETLKQDFAPLTIIPRGFGGSNMKEAFYYSNRILIPYKPRAVVLYEGDNDIAQGISPERILEAFREFIKNLHSSLPGTRVYYISIKPSMARLALWDKMKQANRLIEEECLKSEYLRYIDLASCLLDEKGMPKKEFYLADNLHLSREGYKAWTAILKPILMESEQKGEAKK
ncbi:MAG: hypothetical protein HUU50_09870 [Candidatus Brocadiae bacterium]|nr:hypothetical protein [Candidatus Brocadiia bacterium]